MRSDMLNPDIVGFVYALIVLAAGAVVGWRVTRYQVRDCIDLADRLTRYDIGPSSRP